MANISLKHIYKVYPNGLKAVSDFNMEIEDKEFIVFVGPSGCGKSTTLRMIAGLEDITAGELYIGDALVNDVEPKDRDIAMVFQNYALYPHMTVYDNIAFGLKLRKVPKPEVDRRVNEAAEILGITDYLKKKPKEMSGGQRQRVALGRAIVREPKVFLLDEPLSNLDAKLRTSMRSEISKLHQKLKTTFIYVTHDQIEAMTMGTRIVVMKDGFIQQIDSPRNLYNYPCNKFVAGFIGTPQMNFYKAVLKASGTRVNVTFDNTPVSMHVAAADIPKADKLYFNGKPVIVGIRSEHISVDPAKYPAKAKCKVYYVEDLGIDSQVYADFDIDTESISAVMDSETKVVIKAPAGSHYDVGEIIEVSLDLNHMQIFDAETEQTIMPRIPEKAQLKGTVADGYLTMGGLKRKLPASLMLENGEYLVEIPTSEIHFGGKTACVVQSEEKINGSTLVGVALGRETVYVIDDGGDRAGIDYGYTAMRFIRDGEIVKDRIPAENVLEGKLVHNKKTKTEPESYVVSGDGFEYPVPNEVAAQMVATVGKEIYKDTIALKFGTDAITIGGEGVAANVEYNLDYGADKITVLKVGETTIYAKAMAEPKTAVKLNIPLDKTAVYVKEQDLRLL